VHKDSSRHRIASLVEPDRVSECSCAPRAGVDAQSHAVARDPYLGFERAIMSSQDGTEHELDVLLAKAGASVPPHLKAGVLAGYRDMKVMAARVRQPRTAAAEPSNVFSLKSYAGGA
jgi:hypothetical protein